MSQASIDSAAVEAIDLQPLQQMTDVFVVVMHEGFVAYVQTPLGQRKRFFDTAVVTGHVHQALHEAIA